jgi:hypothetical protein
MEITGFRAVMSDDGNSALVELIARERKAFHAVPSVLTRADVKVFEKAKSKKNDTNRA